MKVSILIWVGNLQESGYSDKIESIGTPLGKRNLLPEMELQYSKNDVYILNQLRRLMNTIFCKWTTILN